MQTGLLVTGRAPLVRFRQLWRMPMVTIRVPADYEIQDAIIEAATDFELRLSKMDGSKPRCSAAAIPLSGGLNRRCFCMSEALDMRDAIIPKSDQLNTDDLIGGPLTVRITKVSRANTAAADRRQLPKATAANTCPASPCGASW